MRVPMSRRLVKSFEHFRQQSTQISDNYAYGGVVTLSASRVRDQDGVLGLQVNVDTGLVQTWPNWLAIAFDRLQEANGARQRLTEATASGVGEAETSMLIEEYQAGLQAISSTVFALDALYGVIEKMITVPEAEKARRKQRKDGRAVWVADAIIRASARMPNDVRKTVTENIHKAYRARDLSVHPPHVQEPYSLHPQLPNTRVPKRWIDYNFKTSMELARWVVEAMIWVIDHPQPRNRALTTWAATASGMLHRIVDPFMNADPSSPLALRRPN